MIFSDRGSILHQEVAHVMNLIDYSKLRTSDNNQIVHYFRDLSRQSSAFSITRCVLNGIECGSLPPYIATIWLSFAKSAEATRLAINQDFSVQVR